MIILKRILIYIVLLFVWFQAIIVVADEYIMPAQLTGLDPSLRARLTDLGCKIPIEIDGISVTPLIIGQFGVIGQVDMAVICARDNDSKILVFWGGEAKCSDTISSYGQSLSVVGKDYIMSHYEAYGGREPPEIKHEGINDLILEKASVVQYCYDGNWLELTGAD